MICIAGIIAGAGVLVTSKFAGTMTACYNDSYSDVNTSSGYPPHCMNSSNTEEPTFGGSGGESGLNLSAEYYATWKGIVAQGDIAEQIPTVAIIAVMAIIIAVLSGVFVYVRYFG